MHTILRVIAVSFLTVGTLALTGCQNIQPTIAHGESGFAGGTGAFGEDPVSPGAYHNHIVTPPNSAVAVK